MEDTATISMKRTPLYEVQTRRNPKWGAFGGWELPIYYTSILDEHNAVRNKAGLFDVSHLAHLEVSDMQGVDALQPIMTQDLNKLGVGQALYSPMLNEQGFIIDEMILYRLSETQTRLVVNAANGDKVLAWLNEHLAAGAEVQDLRDQYGTLALQGPKALEFLSSITDQDWLSTARYSVQAATLFDRPIYVARTGYTGEDGGELFVRTEDMPFVWDTLLEKGEAIGLQPIGLGARDTLRLEAGLPLGGSDLDPMTTPLESRLGWTLGWDADFIGKEALLAQKESGVKRVLAGFVLEGPGVVRGGYPIFDGDDEIGVVTSGTILPSKQSIGLGFVPPEKSAVDTTLEIQIHNRKVTAKIVKLPFYRRKK